MYRTCGLKHFALNIDDVHKVVVLCVHNLPTGTGSQNGTQIEGVDTTKVVCPFWFPTLSS